MESDSPNIQKFVKLIQDRNDSEIFNMLKDGFDPNSYSNQLGCHLFHLIVGDECEEFAKNCAYHCITYGADPNLRDSEGLTPMHVCALWGRINVFKLLLLKGGDPFIRDDDGLDCYAYALKEGHLGIIHTILTYKTSPEIEKESDNKCNLVNECFEEYARNGKVSDVSRLFNEMLNNNIEIIDDCVESHNDASCPGNTGLLNDTPFIQSEIIECTENSSDVASTIADKISYPSQNSNVFLSCESHISHAASQRSNNIIPEDYVNLSIISNDESIVSICNENLVSNLIDVGSSSARSKNSLNHFVSGIYCLSSKANVSMLQDSKYLQSDDEISCISNISNDLSQNTTSSLYETNPDFFKNVTIRKPYKSMFNSLDFVKYFPPPALTMNKSNRFESHRKKFDKHDSESLVNGMNDKSSNIKTENSMFLNSKLLKILDNTERRNSLNSESPNCDKIDSTSITDAEIEKLKSDIQNRLSICDYVNAVTNTSTNKHIFHQNYDNNSQLKSIENNEIAKCTTTHDVDLRNTFEVKFVRNKNYLAPPSRLRIDPIEDLTSDSFVGVAEEKKFIIDEIGAELVERRFLVKPCVSENEDTFTSVSTDYSLPNSEDYDTDNLRKDLNAYGLIPGPINKFTKKVYIKKIFKMKRKGERYVEENLQDVYSWELAKALKDVSWIENISKLIAFDETVSKQFSNVDSTKKWRGGLQKASFTYLLMDPRITNNLPARLAVMNLDKMGIMKEAWPIFINSIFYVGKGVRSRPYAHLYEAVELWCKTEKKSIQSERKKINRILDIWRSGQGIICLNVFQHVIPVEAFTREAAMIDALTLKKLTNLKSGEYYGIASSWSSKEKKNFGVYLLYRAMNIFLHEGERHIHPSDIK